MKNQVHSFGKQLQVGSPTTLAPLLALAALATLLSTTHAQTPTLVLSNKWSLAAGARWDLDTGNLTRGIAINKVTGNVLLASRTSSNHVAVLSGVDGSEVGYLNVVVDGTNIFGTSGVLPLDLISVANDGAIYAANLQVANATEPNFQRIYRWNSEADGLVNPPQIVYGPANPGGGVTNRYGDTMDIRGAGTNTQIIMSGSGSPVFGVFTTTNGTNFTATQITHGLGAGEVGKAITFDGTNNAFYGKKDGSAILRKVSFDLAGGTSALLTNITLTGDLNLVGTKYSSSNGVQFVAGVLTGNAAALHQLKAYTINNPAAPITSASFAFPGPATANGNLVGSSDVGNGMVVGCDPNNGIIALTINFLTNVAPSVITEPQSQTNVLQGGYVTFTVAANGTTPLSYQWRFNETNTFAGATNNSLTLTNLQASNAGDYSCVITNVAGSVTSAPATLVVVPAVLTTAAVPLWSKSVGDLFFLQNDNNHRGMAYDPPTGHVIVVSRTPSNGVHVVDAAAGGYIRSLNMSAVVSGFGEQFPVNMVGVADDGAIYVADLSDVTTTPGNHFQIYRWADDGAATVATIAYPDGNPGIGRIGDALAVRGAGTNTQILVSSRNFTQVALFTTTDGLSFNPTIIDVTTEPAQFAGLGIAFGAGNTFWAKSSGFQFRHIAFDLEQGTNGLLQTFVAGQTTSVALGVDPVNDLVAGVVPNTGTRPIPDHVDLYDVHDVLTGAATEPALIDQDFFKTSNVNGNGTGAVSFDVAGGRLFALDSNNGILALKVVARLFTSNATSSGVTLTWTGPNALQSATVVTGVYTTVTGATSPYTASFTNSAQYFRLMR